MGTKVYRAEFVFALHSGCAHHARTAVGVGFAARLVARLEAIRMVRSWHRRVDKDDPTRKDELLKGDVMSDP